MDNGLIFPYPCAAVQAEASKGSRVTGAFGQRDRGDRSGSRRAGGETQEGSSTGRWLSRGKDVGRHIGKSVCHEPEI
jgi:hypothetical protein